MSVRTTLSIRLSEDNLKLVEVLRKERKLNSYMSLLFSALLQDKVATTQFLLGLSDQSVAYNDLVDSTVKANLYEKWLELKVETPFVEWVETLNSVKLAHLGGLSMPLVDAKSAMLDLLDDLGLELVEQGTETEVVSTEVAQSTELSSSVSSSSSDLEVLVARLVAENLNSRLGSDSSLVTPKEEVTELVEAPTESLEEVSEEVEGFSQEVVSATVEKPVEVSKEQIVDKEEEVVSSREDSAESSSDNSEIDELIDTDALIMQGFM